MERKKKSTKADIDREIMGTLCNFVYAETGEYKIFLMIGGDRNDYMYLATHAKRAGVDKEIAIEVSMPFLKHRFQGVDERMVRNVLLRGNR